MDPMTWIYLIVLVVSLIVAYARVQRPKSTPAPLLSDFDVPTAEDGREVVDIGGTCWIVDPNVLWYGDLSTTPIKQKGGK